jgi:aldose 1-epimerase
VVVEVGGGLREYVVESRALLDGYPLERMADGGRGQPLLPWPNRLRDGQYTFGEQKLQLPIEEVERHNAMHGLTRWLNWHAIDQSTDHVTLELVLHPRPGYPFTLQLQIDYALGDAGLTVRTTARNVGQTALPFGAGQHPYFSVGTPSVDAATLQIGASGRLELDPERRLPTGRILPVANTDLDFRSPRPIGPLVLDDCFCQLARDADGRARVRLSSSETGTSLTVWMGEHYGYAQVFSGDTLVPERRLNGLAIEPMTCPPDAFRSGTDLIVLAPGESVQLAWGVEFTMV